MRTLLAGLVLTVAAAAACSSSGDVTAGTPGPASSGTASGPGSSAPPAASSAPTGTESVASGGTSGGTGGDSALAAKLLTAAQVGPGFVAQAQDVTKATPAPCKAADSPTLDTQVPPQAKVEDIYTKGRTIELNEELTDYTDEATALRAVAIGKTGLACTSGKIYGDDGSATPVQIAAPTSPDLGIPEVDETSQWVISGSGFKGALLLIRYNHSHLMVITFLADPSTPAADLPSSNQIVSAALTKVLH